MFSIIPSACAVEWIMIFVFHCVTIKSIVALTWIICFSSICACRFLYPIYPLICVAASAVIESFPDFFRSKYNPYDRSIIVTVRYQFTWDLDRSLYIRYGSNKYILNSTHAKCRLPKLWDQWFLALYYMPLMPVHFLWSMVTPLP